MRFNRYYSMFNIFSSVNGVHTIDWQGSDQPNNFHGVDYCAAMRFDSSGGTVGEGELVDERCRENHLSVCELQSGG